MVEIWPKVKIVDGGGVLDFTFKRLNSVYFDGLHPGGAMTYGEPDLDKEAEITAYALPEDEIVLNAPAFNPLRFNNSIVSSGARNVYFVNCKIPHTPVYPTGSGKLILIWKTTKINLLLANNVEPVRAHYLFKVQDTTTYSTTTRINLLEYDFGTIARRDIIFYGSVWNSLSSYPTLLEVWISNDGASWTRIGYVYNATTREAYGALLASNTEFRYLRVRGAPDAGTGYFRVRKVLVFE